jgi:RNA polymerase sigma factor (sigma-70 family)
MKSTEVGVDLVYIGENEECGTPCHPDGKMNHEAMEKTDSDILRVFFAGDQGALETIFRRYEVRIYAYCRNILGNREDAEDALQETFLRISRQRSFEGDRVQAWIYRIALNVCRSHLRKRASRISRELRSEDTLPQTPAPTPAQVYAKQVTENEVSKAISALPEIQREVIVLKYLDHLKTPEIVDILEVSLSTVEGRLRQGREKLRRILIGSKER